MSCGFSRHHQNETSEKVRSIKHSAKKGAIIWIGGCVPSINPDLTTELAVDHSFGPRSLENVERLVDFDFGIANHIAYESNQTITGLNKEISIVRVNNGCLDRCSYCAIRKASGKLKSRTVDEILAEVESAVRRGCTVCQFVGEDLGCYGMDIGADLLMLCQAIDKMHPSIRILLSSVNPRYFIQSFDMFTELLSLSVVGKRFSLPVQSGSDRILAMMSRKYCIDDYVKAVEHLKSMVPECEIATDFIVGFPTESEEEFQKSRALLKRIDFEYVDCFKFDALEGTDIMTRASDDVPEAEKLRRLRILVADATSSYFRRKGISSFEDIRRFVEDPNTRLPVNTNAILTTE
jgi:MiaB/RimO family radical SAM methylthiotransferase